MRGYIMPLNLGNLLNSLNNVYRLKKLNYLVRNLSEFSTKHILNDKHVNEWLMCVKKMPAIGEKNFSKEQIFAAVLVPLCLNEENEISLLYTKRSGTMSRHVRQISFPGGLRENDDNSFEDCALRETEEEIGLKRTNIEILGTGNLIFPPKSAAIMPVFANIINFSKENLILNKDEVEMVLTIPIRKLCDNNSTKHTQFKSGYSSPLFVIDSYKIWGITAYITYMFLKCVLSKNVYQHNLDFITPFKEI